jgi:hypothetical protein
MASISDPIEVNDNNVFARRFILNQAFDGLPPLFRRNNGTPTEINLTIMDYDIKYLCR